MNKDIVKKKINECVLIIDEEIDKHLQGKDGIGELSTLKAIKTQLLSMEDAMSSKIYVPSYDYILRDDLWSYKSISGILLDAYYLYMKLD